MYFELQIMGLMCKNFISSVTLPIIVRKTIDFYLTV